jgi:hypothetical protein
MLNKTYTNSIVLIKNLKRLDSKGEECPIERLEIHLVNMIVYLHLKKKEVKKILNS